MKAEDSPSPSPFKPSKNRPDSDTATESRSPIPEPLIGGQPAPEEFGQQSYTSRQPWMSRDEPVVDAQGSSSGFVVDGATLSPFGESTSEPKPHEENGTDGALTGSESESTPERRAAPAPVIRRRSRGNGVFFSLFLLFAKALPLMLVLGGGYYTYSYYFGPIPVVDQAWRKTASLVGIKAAPPPERSKASQILQQTRAVVHANDSRVNFASALANEDVDLNTLSSPEDVPVASPKVTEPQPVVTVESSSAETDRGPGLAMELAGNLAESIKAKLTGPRSETPEIPVEKPQPSSAFITWVNQARISGVRRGVHPKIFINDLPVTPGEVIYHPLKITVVGIDPDDTYLIFQDKTGATYRRRY